MAVLLALAGMAAAADQELRVVFLNPEEAGQALADETSEKYFSRMQELEIRARTAHRIPPGPLDRQRAGICDLYRNGALPFADSERQALQSALALIHPHLQARAPRLAALPWRFIKLSQNLEGGLPHTRGNQIVLPALLVEAAAHMPSVDPARSQAILIHVLLHEQMHVLQRGNPALFEPLYQQWGFRKAPQLHRTGILASHQILNPDTLDENWIWIDPESGHTRAFWPLTLLDPAAQPGAIAMPVHLRVVAAELKPAGQTWELSLDTDGEPIRHPLSQDQAYAKMFPLRHNHSHPHEISAEIAARLIGGPLATPGKSDLRLESFRNDLESLLTLPAAP